MQKRHANPAAVKESSRLFRGVCGRSDESPAKRTGPSKPISSAKEPEGSGMPVAGIAGLMGTESNRWIRLLIGLSLLRLPSRARRRHRLRSSRKQIP